MTARSDVKCNIQLLYGEKLNKIIDNKIYIIIRKLFLIKKT